jgi:hypothetical protein
VKAMLLRAHASRLRRLHTIIDAAASCIGGIAERARCGERDGLRSAAPSMVRRAGMWVGRVQFCCCASSCGVHGAGFGGAVAHPATGCMGQLRGRMHGCGT